jgi:zinc protease
MKLWRSLALLGLALTAACSGATTPTPVPSASSSTGVAAPVEPPLPLDARITKGTLESGLTYYILPNKKPEKRAQMWLVVNTGSVLEDDDQRGLAHLVEHMAFQGTKRFPKQDIVSFMEKSGMRFGADLNASTSFDETIYMLQIPTDQDGQIDISLQILRDWSEAVTFDATELDRERGVVLEEWRLGRGAGMRMFDKQATIVLGPKYGERITIGKPEIIEKAPRDTVMRFYKDWYRPDLMCVVAVGDFDAKAIEAKIKAEFGSQKKAESPRPRPAVEVPASAETRVSIETDPELTGTEITILSELPHRPEASEKDYRRGLAEQLYGQMLNARLEELARDVNAPFLGASVATRTIVRTEDAFALHANVKEDGVLRGASAMLEEVLRVERHGFTQTELDRAKAGMLRLFEQAAIEREKANSTALAREITRNFLQAEAMPGIEAERDLAKKLLPTLELAELNQMAQAFAAGSRVITVSGPPTMEKPSKESVLALAKDVAAREITAYVDEVPTEPLMKSPPAKGSVKSEKKIPELGVTEWTLSNGARVVVKPTDFANDSIQMVGFATGGTSLARDAA